MRGPTQTVKQDPRTIELTPILVSALKANLGCSWSLGTDDSIIATRRAVDAGLITLTTDQAAWLAKVEVTV
jgi:hypothetical protein